MDRHDRHSSKSPVRLDSSDLTLPMSDRSRHVQATLRYSVCPSLDDGMQAHVYIRFRIDVYYCGEEEPDKKPGAAPRKAIFMGSCKPQ